MSVYKDKVQEFLKAIAPAASLTAMTIPGVQSAWKAEVNHMGVLMTLSVLDSLYMVIVNFGYLPKANVAPLYRQLLTTNLQLQGHSFMLNENTNMLSLQASGPVDELSQSLLLGLMNRIAITFLTHATRLVQQFAIPTTLQ